MLSLSARAQTLGMIGAETTSTTQTSLPAMQMLMKGSILQRVILPQYDAQQNLSSVLRASLLELVDDQTIDGTTVQIKFYKPDRSVKAQIDLQKARLENFGLLRSEQAVTLAADDLSANGTGLIYDLETSRGFLVGPATARTMIESNKTSMNSKSHRMAAAAGLSLIATPLTGAEGLNPLSSQAGVGLQQLAISEAPAANAAAEKAERQLELTSTQSANADQGLDAFLEQAALPKRAGTPANTTAPVPQPASDETAKLPATIKAKDGIYFDSERGLLVFLKAVDVDHPEFSLTGGDEVKVFFDKDPGANIGENEQPPNGEVDPTLANEMMSDVKFGDPSKIVANGTLVVTRKVLKPNDTPIKASGRQMILDLKTNDLLISGGEPWIISNTASGRVVDPQGYIRVNMQSGDASFVGASEGFIDTSKQN